MAFNSKKEGQPLEPHGDKPSHEGSSIGIYLSRRSWGVEETEQGFQSVGWTYAQSHKDIKMLDMGSQAMCRNGVRLCAVVGAEGWAGDMWLESRGPRYTAVTTSLWIQS